MPKRPAPEPEILYIPLKEMCGGIKVYLLRDGEIIASRIYPEQERMSYALKDMVANLPDPARRYCFIHEGYIEEFKHKNRSIKNVMRNMLGIMTIL